MMFYYISVFLQWDMCFDNRIQPKRKISKICDLNKKSGIALFGNSAFHETGFLI